MRTVNWYPVIAVAAALAVGAVIIALMGKDPFQAYWILISGIFAGKNDFAVMLIQTTPLLFAGAAVAFTFRAGLFNIGVQGQMILGGLAAAAVGAFTTIGAVNNVAVALSVAAIAAMLWAGVAGYLKARFGAHEVITTIMMNYIAYSIELYMLNTLMKQGGLTGPSPQTPPITEASKLPSILPPTSLNVGFIIGIAVVILLWFIMERTKIGYEIRAVGQNIHAAKNAGINTAMITVAVMLISGFAAGLGGAERVLGGVNQDRYILGSMAEYGFDGIAVALVGKNHPAGIIAAAFLFGLLRTGAMNMQFEMGVPNQISIIIQALIIIFIVAENGFGHLKQLFKKLRLSTVKL